MAQSKWKRGKKWLWLVPVPLLLWPLLAGDALDRKLRSLAGPSAVNCGVLTGYEADLDGKADEMNACATRAAAQNRPLFARQNFLVDGVRGVGGVARTPEGRIYFLNTSKPWLPFFFGEVGAWKPGKASKRKSGDYWMLY